MSSPEQKLPLKRVGEPAVVNTFKLLFQLSRLSWTLANGAASEIRPHIKPYLQQRLADLNDWFFTETHGESLFSRERRQHIIETYLSDHS